MVKPNQKENTMWGKIHPWSKTLALVVAVLILAGAVASLRGQEEEPEVPDEAPELPELPQIFITGNDVTNPPAIILHVYGRDDEGKAIDFTSEPLTMTSNGTPVIPSVTDGYPAGTFTIFLIDIPTGVEAQLPAIQDSIKQFASAGSGMQEQIDYVAIYQVGESEASQLLPPDNFYNSVNNFFMDDLTPETGSTALIDSLVSMLEQVEDLKPDPIMASSIVVMSDGTDVVSTQFEPADIYTRTLGLNLPIHTIWVDSTDLTFAGQQQGQAFLQEIADNSYGVATTLDDSEGLAEIWSHIASFREHARVGYVLDELAGGSFDIELRLTNDPSASDSMIVEMPDNQPQVTLDLPEGVDSLSLPSLEEPISLRLSATVSWLDGLEREITEAYLSVNGREVAEVPVEDISDFTAELTNLQFGQNALEIVVTDEQGLNATNPPTMITVTEGEQDIPRELRPGLELGNIVLDIFLILVVLAVIGVIIYLIVRWGRMPTLFPKGRSKRSQDGVTYATSETPAEAKAAMEDYGRPVIQAYLEVIESITEMPQYIELSGQVVRLGRTPTQSDIAFREDLTVSRQHANLMLEGNHYRIFDEGSTSGTWVNGRQVPDYGVELMDGDEIHLGAVHLLFRQI
jgi:hypothetical protein